MNRRYNFWWFACRQTRQKGAFSIVDNESILTIGGGTASVGAVHKSIAIAGVSEEFLDTVYRKEVILDSTFCTLDIELAHADFYCRA